MTDYFNLAEKALDYLHESEPEYARLKAMHKAEEKRLDIVKASKILDSQESSQGLREQDAKASEDYREAVAIWEDTLENFYLIEAKRKRAELTIEMYRSVNSAQKRGNMI